MKPRLLDLFCGAGGAAMGYHQAGFDVVGVDIHPQPNYPFEFIRAEALNYLKTITPAYQFDAIHASPPCQAFTAYRRKGHGVGDSYPDLIAPTRELLQQTGLPWVIENVVGATLEAQLVGYDAEGDQEIQEPVLLCGTMLDPPMEIQRHRLFETNWPLEPPTWPCRHSLNGPRFPASTNRRRGSRRTIAIGQWNTPLERQHEAMGIDWMTLEELSEALPPVYTRFIGDQLINHARAPA